MKLRRQLFFSLRVVDIYNYLPEYIISALSINIKTDKEWTKLIVTS